MNEKMTGPVDLSWAPYARATREVLELLGFGIGPSCLPDEPEACGGTFAQHAAAHLAAIKAVADHQLRHLGAPDSLVQSAYDNTMAELEHGRAAS